MKIKKNKTKKEKAKVLRMKPKKEQPQEPQKPAETNFEPIGIGVMLSNNHIVLKFDRKTDMIVMPKQAANTLAELIKSKIQATEKTGIKLYDAFGKEVH